ncbi:hypothetical protein AMATHDRAFT_49275 [Amanita thiersii Skay4041]|uniref:DUF6533 domain-containing protein n=1 Tax=Amanita thiersii Skay4041 TaxID=703135 RepID=A0A2A9NLX8_9AGAR|nr:hypothetical protein AMATHDRAFT_49275 [Amanita thiersii Skay4041]
MINDTLRFLRLPYLYTSTPTQLQVENLINSAQQFLDYFLTLDSEVTLIWQSDWRTLKVLFLVMRYTPFVDVTLRLFNRVVPSALRQGCVLSAQIAPVSIAIGLAAAECLLAVRTWCLWNRHRAIGIVIFFLATGGFISIVVLVVQYLISVKYVPSPFPSQTPCTISAVDELFIAYAILLMFEISEL